MARPVVVVVDDEDASRRALARELESRYGPYYWIMSGASPEEGLAGLEQLRGEGAEVPLVLADQWMPGTTGVQFLARVRELFPAARRGLLISWGDQSATTAIVEAAALGQIDFSLPKPVWSPDEQFHRAITRVARGVVAPAGRAVRGGYRDRAGAVGPGLRAPRPADP
jgi:thioredoxin reductase (NADPH)